MVAPSPPAPAPRRRRLLPRFLLLALTLAVTLVVAEAALRLADGYRLWPVALRHVLTDADDAATLRFHRDLLDGFTSERITGRPGLDPAWLLSSPPPLPRHPVPPELEERFRDHSQWLFLYHVNEVLLRASWEPGVGVRQLQGIAQPDSFWTFAPRDGRPAPLYRYPPSVTLPTGMTTNRFGFRGPEVAYHKPPKVVRIACVGASTTVNAPRVPHSYPELLQHWLDLAAVRRGWDVRFEVLNAGREAIRSADIRAIVEDEVLPLVPDYVVYYEGANQFHPQHLLRQVRIGGEYRLADPPPGLVPAQEEAAVAAGDLTLLDRACAWSAGARRLRSLLQRGERLREPPKPAQRIELPPGLDAQDPDPALAAGLLDLGAVFGDLEAMRQACAGAGARFVLCSFCWLAEPGMTVDAVMGRHIFIQLNRAYWPFSYATIRELADLQNRAFAAWARRQGVDFVDVAAAMPNDERLYFDAIHNTSIGVRLRAFCVLRELLPLLERDLAAGTIPVRREQPGEAHPFLGPVRVITRAELDRR